MLQKEVAVVISNIKVHKDDVSTDAVLPPAEQECHLRNRLNTHLEELGKSFKESDYVDLNPYIDEITKEVTEKCQEVLKKELRVNLEDLVNKSCEDMIDHQETINKAVNEDMRRITGVVSATGGKGQVDAESMAAQQLFLHNSALIVAANNDYVFAKEELKGMQAAQSKLLSHKRGRKQWKAGSKLQIDDVKMLAHQDSLEKDLKSSIEDKEKDVARFLKQRYQTSLDILGGGSVNTKDVRTNTAGIRKLVASKFDMSKPADAKTAALIRNCTKQIVKENITQFWKLAAMVELMSSNNLIGKDFYCVKNNLTIMIEDEEEEDYLARLNTMGFTVERLEKFASREEELSLSKHYKKEKEEAAAAADGSSMAPDFDDLETPAEADDDEDDEPLDQLADDLSESMTEDDWRQLESQVEDYVSANGLLFGILNDDLSTQIQSACSNSGKLFGESVHDSRINSAANGDGLSCLEAWIFSSELFGDRAHENAADFLKQAAGWFIQDNWKGGLKTVREGLQKAIDLKVEVTWAQTIAKYMGVLLVHRGVIALQLRDVYGSPPKDKNANQIHQILFFVGALEMYLNQATGKDKPFEKMDKESRRTRAHYVNIAHCFAYEVVEANEKEWDNVPHEFRPTANFTQKNPKKQHKDKKEKKGGGKKFAANKDSTWRPWLHASHQEIGGKRICDNQGCSIPLNKSEYQAVCSRQEQKDGVAVAAGYTRASPCFHTCSICHLKKGDDVVFPDGYLPKVPGNVTDRTKATPAWTKAIKDKEARREQFKAAKANMASRGNETESCSEEDDSDDDAISMVSGSTARSQAKSTQSNQNGKMKKMAEKINALEREAAAKEMKEKDESMSEMKAKLAAMEDYLMNSDDEPKPEKSASKSARKSAAKGRITYLKALAARSEASNSEDSE